MASHFTASKIHLGLLMKVWVLSYSLDKSETFNEISIRYESWFFFFTTVSFPIKIKSFVDVSSFFWWINKNMCQRKETYLISYRHVTKLVVMTCHCAKCFIDNTGLWNIYVRNTICQTRKFPMRCRLHMYSLKVLLLQLLYLKV